MKCILTSEWYQTISLVLTASSSSCRFRAILNTRSPSAAALACLHKHSGTTYLESLACPSWLSFVGWSFISVYIRFCDFDFFVLPIFRFWPEIPTVSESRRFRAMRASSHNHFLSQAAAALLVFVLVVSATSIPENKDTPDRFWKNSECKASMWLCFVPSDELPPNTKYTVVTYHTPRPPTRKHFVTMTGLRKFGRYWWWA